MQRFQKNLAFLRSIAPVETIAMEGAPFSKYDNRELWRREEVRDEGREVRDESEELTIPHSPLTAHHSPLIAKKSYRDFGIIGEPYFDLDFNEVFYLTDTGRRWDGWRVSLRDKVPQQNEWIKQGLVFHSTCDIINAAKQGRLPNQIMMTFHPQRWSAKPLPWIKELLWQGAKNVGKSALVKLRG